MLLRRRLLLLFVAIVAAVLALGVLMVLTLRERDDAQQRERRLSVAVERVAQLSTAYADQETGERGYVLERGRDSFLEPYDERPCRGTRGSCPSSAPTLDTPAPPRRSSQRVTAAIGHVAQQAAEPEIALRDAPVTSAGAARLVADGQRQGAVRPGARGAGAARPRRSRPRRAAREQHLDDIRVPAHRDLRGDRAWSRSSARSLAGLAHPPLGDAADRPARRRGAARARRRARLADPDPGPPELASLALDVDAMRGRIRQQLVESERSRQAVEQSAAVVLTLRSELEPVVGDMPDGWTVAGRLRAAEGVVAGDCYDLFTTRDGEIALVVVDIAGHGATEGILALRCKEMLRTALTSGAAPGDALDTTAEILGDMGDEVFLTAFVAAIDTGDGTVRYANAGHPPAYVVGDDVGVAARTDRPAGRPARARAGRPPRRRSRPATTSAPTPTGSSRPATPTTSSSVPNGWWSCCRALAATRRRRW